MSRRYPLAPLLDALGCDETTVKARLGLDHRQVARYVAQGLTERRADELASKGGAHPAAIWFDFGMAEESVPCAECSELFVPTRKGHRYCSTRCGDRAYNREWKRRRYQSDAAHREAKKASNAAYKATAGRVIRMKDRAYHAAQRDRRNAARRERYWRNAEREKAAARARYHASKETAV